MAISNNDLIMTMYELHSFSVIELSRTLRLKGHKCSNSSMRVRLERIAAMIDTKTGLASITKVKHGGKLFYNITEEQACRLLEREHFIKQVKTPTVKVVKKNEEAEKVTVKKYAERKNWGENMKGAPGTTVLMLSE